MLEIALGTHTPVRATYAMRFLSRAQSIRFELDRLDVCVFSRNAVN